MDEGKQIKIKVVLQLNVFHIHHYTIWLSVRSGTKTANVRNVPFSIIQTVEVLTFRSNQKDEQRKLSVGYDMELLTWIVLALTDFTSWLRTLTWSW
jgi:hypothetical protein